MKRKFAEIADTARVMQSISTHGNAQNQRTIEYGEKESIRGNNNKLPSLWFEKSRQGT